jgi:DNA repair protein RadC
MQLKSPKYIYEKDRPREKLKEKGVGALTDLELLMVLIGSGTKKNNVTRLADQVLTLLSEKRKNISMQDLTDLQGLNIAKASVVLAALELATRKLIPSMACIKRPQDILPLVSKYAGKKQEHLVCFSLNGAGAIIEERVISIGILNSTLIHPREVFADAITDRAASILLVHNHPSNITSPSEEDILLTKKIQEVGEIIGIRLVDHIIVTKSGGYYSFEENASIDTSFSS